MESGSTAPTHPPSGPPGTVGRWPSLGTSVTQNRRYGTGTYPGRLRTPDRAALAGVMYVLRTGVAWRDVPAETVGCSGVTAWRRLRDWTEAGVWPRLHATLLAELRRADLLDLDDCSVDGSHVRALKDTSRCYAVKFRG
ncbi:hypothetical protein GCM10010271_73920 [Streptomyces kurssanovii]|nr:hypothetical protein GCM10010271_73920 [Streptomyces kurssanovii]